MSTAHRPTWDPAQAKDVKGGSRQFSVRDMAAHTFGQRTDERLQEMPMRSSSELIKAQMNINHASQVAEKYSSAWWPAQVQMPHLRGESSHHVHKSMLEAAILAGVNLVQLADRSFFAVPVQYPA